VKHTETDSPEAHVATVYTARRAPPAPLVGSRAIRPPKPATMGLPVLTAPRPPSIFTFGIVPADRLLRPPLAASATTAAALDGDKES
jgi:hypothetical protein